MAYIGFDTSNYTTSAAVYFPEENRIYHKKLLLPVAQGARGLRQSDAVFHHTVQLSTVFSELSESVDFTAKAVGASSCPRMTEGSYMPCFLVGVNAGRILARAQKVNFHTTSHQNGHILAALYACGRLDLINERFVAFHFSGGTTEALLVEPDSKEIINCTLIAQSSDLKAGQAVDRVGLMMGLAFPGGPELDKLAQRSKADFRIRVSSKGKDVSLSGVENKCKKMLDEGAAKEDVARYCIEYICACAEKMTEDILTEYGKLPIVYSGGVMSNTIIRKRLEEKFSGYFAPAEFSSDNAAGVAILTYLKEQRL